LRLPAVTSARPAESQTGSSWRLWPRSSSSATSAAATTC
jgi:hypothetical protein